MKIAQIATASGPVRADNTGSVESLVWLLTRELTALGHEVTVFGCGDYSGPGRFVRTLPGPYGCDGSPYDWHVCEWITLCAAVERAAEFDVLHAHAYMWSLPLDPLSASPLVHTTHTCPYDDEVRLWDRHPDACVTAISHHQWRAVTDRQPAAVVYHGVDPADFTLRETPDDYVCYLGRFLPGKGPLEAIDAAQAAGLPIVLAGPSNDYFEAEVRPRVDGKNVRYAGLVDRRQRDALLGGARALVYPVLSPEPFGLVQVEAMMCGTPVAATRAGAIPEIIDEGLTGATADSPASLASALHAAINLDRPSVRRHAESRFSARRMASDYQRVYQSLLASRRTR